MPLLKLRGILLMTGMHHVLFFEPLLILSSGFSSFFSSHSRKRLQAEDFTLPAI